MQKESKIYIAGHTGMVGIAIVRKLQEEGYMAAVAKGHMAAIEVVKNYLGETDERRRL